MSSARLSDEEQPEVTVTMPDLLGGQRVGSFVVFKDEDGLRHAVKCGAVLALSDSDDVGAMTVMQMAGNKAVLIRSPIDEVIGWFK